MVQPNNEAGPIDGSAGNVDPGMAPSASMARTATLSDYIEVTKPKVVLLLVFTALVGMVLSVPGMLPLQETYRALTAP